MIIEMKKLLVINLITLFTIRMANAQNDMTVLYDQHFSHRGAKYIPAKLGMDYSNIYLNTPLLASVYGYGNNSMFGINAVLKPTEERIDRAVDNTKDFGIVGAGVESDLFAFAYKLKKEDESEFMNFSFDVSNKIGANFLVGGNLLKLAWNGNKQFEGQDVQLGPLAVNASVNTYYTLGWSMPLPEIKFIPDDYKFRVGARLKYVNSIMGLYMPRTEATMSTAAGGRRIAINDLNYQLNHTYFDQNNPLKSKGNGYGADLSVHADIKDDFAASLSLIDLGRVKYKNNTVQYAYEGDFVYEGVRLKNIFVAPEIDADSAILGELRADRDSGSVFKMPLPARLVLQGEYIIDGKTNGKKRPFNEQTIYFTYIQGFNNTPGATTKPFFSLGYMYSLNYVLNAGTTLNYGGYGRFGMGLITSVRLGPWRFGVGSSNALSFLVMRENASGLDASFNVNWAF